MLPVVSAAVWTAVLWGWFVDDAGIVFSYARSLAEGLGPVPHPYSPPVEGYSDPLWVAVLAVAGRLGIPIDLAARFMGVGCMVLACGLIDRAVRRHGGSVVQRWAVAVTLSLSGPIWLWASSGLESGPWTLAIVAAVFIRPPLLATLVAMAAVWLRPEAPLVLLGVMAARHRLGHDVRTMLLGIVVALVGQFSLRAITFGSWWPQTATAKLHTPLWTRAMRGMVYIGVSSLWLGLLPLTPGWIRQDGHPRLHRLIHAAVPVALTTGMAMLYMGGDWMRYGRFGVALVPLLVAAAVPALVTRGRAWLAAAWLFSLVISVDVMRRPPLPLAIVAEAADVMVTTARARCEADVPHIALPDVGGALWKNPRVDVTDLARLTTAPDAAWPAVLASHPPHVLLVHGPWVRRTGLTPEVLNELGYDALCIRPPAPGPSEEHFPTTLYVLSRCNGASTPSEETALQTWCARPR